MSKGDLNSYGGKKNNFSFQQSLLMINGLIQQASAAGATEATLQLVLTALQNGQDYEAKLVRDSDTPSVTWLEVRIFNQTTGVFDPPMYYPAGSNTPGSPVLPITYIDPTTLLATIAANTTGLATEVTLAGIKSQTDLLNFIATALEVNVSTSVLPTGAATAALQTALNGLVATEATALGIKTQTDLLNFIATALEVNVSTSVLPTGAATSALQTSLNALITSLNGLVATEATLATRASEATAAAINTKLTGASRTPAVSVIVADGSTAAGAQEVSLWFRGTGGTLDGAAVPAGAQFTFRPLKGEDTVGAIAYTVPTGGSQEIIISTLT